MTRLPLPLSTACAAGKSAAPATVLVVDDDVMVLQALRILLEDHGFTVLTASDGNDGLRAYREHRPDLVLTDIVMPEKEGISLIRDLRHEFPGAKIVAISGGGRMGNSDYIRIATALGADAGLYKPFDDVELLQALDTLLGRAMPPAHASAA